MKNLKLLILLLVPLLLTGCYDRKELDDLAYVIELHLANKIVRISDLMLNNTLKDMIQYLRHLCIA